MRGGLFAPKVCPSTRTGVSDRGDSSRKNVHDHAPQKHVHGACESRAEDCQLVIPVLSTFVE